MIETTDPTTEYEPEPESTYTPWPGAYEPEPDHHRIDIVGALLGGVLVGIIVVTLFLIVAHVLVAESRDHRANTQARTFACLGLGTEVDRAACLKALP